MNRPGMRTMLLGSRFTAPFIMMGCVDVAYRWWEAGGQSILGLLAIALFFASAKAAGDTAAYRQWRADWRGMTGASTARRKLRPATVATLVALAMVGAAVAVASQLDLSPAAHDWLVLGAIVCALLGAVLMLGRITWLIWPRRRRPKPTPLVSVAVHAAAVPVPTIRDAYQRLPDYCLQLLKGQAS